jgi:hypothetical protein
MKYFLTWVVVIVAYCVNAQPAISLNQDEYISNLLAESSVFDTAAIAEEQHEESITVYDREDAWKGWATVENYTYGKDRGALPMISDLNALHPYFRDRILDLINACKQQGIELAVVESFRTHAKQSEYFGMGRKYTRSKGGKSKHQYGLAVDVVPIVDGAAVWDNTVLWKRIGMQGEKLGLRWGGRWRAPYDPAHFEWSGGITTTHLAKGLLPSIPKSKLEAYPCLEEELTWLQKYWENWEMEQAVSASSAISKSTKTSGSAGQKP